MSYTFEANAMATNGTAIKVFKDNIHIGYIKIIHDSIFFDTKGYKLNLKTGSKKNQMKN
ncbi:MAG: hypothetical protein U9R19_00930 [Bacteroidota bacterium]|nr:hypothetical protein [Bacteroidota bacterium]